VADLSLLSSSLSDPASPERPVLRDYVAWHDAYRDPGSELSVRLRHVQQEIAVWLGRTPVPVTVVSSCASQGHDILGVLQARPQDRSRVRGTLIELDPTNASIARDWIAKIGAGFEVVEADAGRPDAYQGCGPADLVLLSGIIGNISAADIELVVQISRQMCAPGASVLWTRGAQDPDLGPEIHGWFADAGYEEVACEEWIEGAGMRVGVERLIGPPEPLRPGEKICTFYR
jgi:hypothetical protein